MKKIALILFTLLVTISCDDNFKRDTPSIIDNTIWSAEVKIDDSTIEYHYIKFYTDSYDMLYQKYENQVLTISTTTSGKYTYRMPKVTLFIEDSPLLYAMITGKYMLLSNNLLLRINDAGFAF